METVGYCVRVQALEGYGLKIHMMTAIDDYAAMLAVRHHGSKKENPHYHIVVRTPVKPQAFRVRMKQQFPDGKGNAHMSIVPWDGNNDALSYLFHELEPDESADLIARKGLTDEQLHELRKRNDAVKVEVQKAKSKASVTLEDDAYEHFKNKSERTDWVIAQFMFLHALRNGKYPPQTWLVRSMVARVQFRLLNGVVRDEEQMCEAMAKDIFCRYDH